MSTERVNKRRTFTSGGVLKVLLALLLALALLCCATIGGAHIALYRPREIPPKFGVAPKTILFIGDGMGENHIKVAQVFSENPLFPALFTMSGEVCTNSLELVAATDSAAAATAMATGVKVKNNYIAFKDGENIPSISEYAKSQGLGVGIVTTDELCGATPAGFSAHSKSRNVKIDIVMSQYASGIDLFLGAGKSTYDQYASRIEDNGYAYINDYSALDTSQGKIFAAFTGVTAKDGTNAQPTLTMLAAFAVEYMESNFPDGYFLMIEGAHIDKASHSNDLFLMIDYMLDFSNTITQTFNTLCNQDGVAFIVTADHETGDLAYAGESAQELSNEMYQSKGHTKTDVKYYFYIKPTKETDLDTLIKNKLDNTDIYHIMRSLLFNN